MVNAFAAGAEVLKGAKIVPEIIGLVVEWMSHCDGFCVVVYCGILIYRMDKGGKIMMMMMMTRMTKVRIEDKNGDGMG